MSPREVFSTVARGVGFGIYESDGSAVGVAVVVLSAVGVLLAFVCESSTICDELRQYVQIFTCSRRILRNLKKR